VCFWRVTGAVTATARAIGHNGKSKMTTTEQTRTSGMPSVISYLGFTIVQSVPSVPQSLEL
jgi:hypothetical protein